VRSERLELSWYCYRQPLKLVRLPIPPRPRAAYSTLSVRPLATHLPAEPLAGSWRLPDTKTDPLGSAP